MNTKACTEPQCLYNGALYLYLYLYSPYGPYSLNRASVYEQRSTLTLPIPLIHLWTVQPVQSLNACTTVHFIFTYTSTPRGPYSLYRASVAVQGCTLPFIVPHCGKDNDLIKNVVKVVSISAENRVHNVLSTSERHCHCARLFCALPVNPRAGIPQDMCS